LIVPLENSETKTSTSNHFATRRKYQLAGALQKASGQIIKHPQQLDAELIEPQQHSPLHLFASPKLKGIPSSLCSPYHTNKGYAEKEIAFRVGHLLEFEQ